MALLALLLGGRFGQLLQHPFEQGRRIAVRGLAHVPALVPRNLDEQPLGHG